MDHNHNRENRIIDIWSFDIRPYLPKISFYQELLSDGELKKAFRFRKRENQVLFIVSHACLRLFLSRYLRTTPNQIRLENSVFGKPYLKGNRDCQFNLSHSHSRVLIAITLGSPLGVDVEYMREIDAMDQIARRFFSDHEYQEYLSLSAHEKLRGFYNAWTRKEAFIKAIGEGLHFPLKNFDVSISPSSPPQILTIRGSINQENVNSWNLFGWSDETDYIMALCYKGPEKKICFHNDIPSGW